LRRAANESETEREQFKKGAFHACSEDAAPTGCAVAETLFLKKILNSGLRICCVARRSNVFLSFVLLRVFVAVPGVMSVSEHTPLPDDVEELDAEQIIEQEVEIEMPPCPADVPIFCDFFCI
jgi:hypothetical protein